MGLWRGFMLLLEGWLWWGERWGGLVVTGWDTLGLLSMRQELN
jgi:hypothetical protein